MRVINWIVSLASEVFLYFLGLLVLIGIIYGLSVVLDKQALESFKTTSKYEAILLADDPTDMVILEAARRNRSRELLIKYAKQELGKPYKLGSVGEDGYFDCSGYIYTLAKRSGIPIPRVSTKVMANWTKVSYPEMSDLPLFAHTKGKIAHVGIWDKPDLEMYHASSSKGIELRNIDTQGGYWRKRFERSVVLPSLEF